MTRIAPINTNPKHVMKYICEHCATTYDKPAACERCEAGHVPVSALKLVNADYSGPEDKLPRRICVRFGKEEHWFHSLAAVADTKDPRAETLARVKTIPTPFGDVRTIGPVKMRAVRTPGRKPGRPPKGKAELEQRAPAIVVPREPMQGQPHFKPAETDADKFLARTTPAPLPPKREGGGMPVPEDTTTVIDMVREVLPDMPATPFYLGALREKMEARHPRLVGKIKTGIYVAVQTALERGELKKSADGKQLVVPKK